jgi:hypothetical protein
MSKAKELIQALGESSGAWNLYMNGKLLVIMSDKKQAMSKKKELEKMSKEEGDGLDKFKIEKSTLMGLVSQPKLPLWMEDHPNFNPLMK